MKYINLMQHDLTKEQIEVLEGWEYESDEVLPGYRPEVLELITFEMFPTKGYLEYRANRLADICQKNGANYALIGGAPFFQSYLENALKNRGVTPLHSFSLRECLEETLADGTVKKSSAFKFLGFIEA